MQNEFFFKELYHLFRVRTLTCDAAVALATKTSSNSITQNKNKAINLIVKAAKIFICLPVFLLISRVVAFFEYDNPGR